MFYDNVGSDTDLFQNTFLSILFLYSMRCLISKYDTQFENLCFAFFFFFSNEKFNSVKYLEANPSSFPLNLWFAVIKTRSNK